MLLPMVAGADEPVKIDGIYYNLNPDTSEAEVTNSLGGLSNAPRSYEGYVTIPSMFSYYGKTYNVTRIGRYAFRNCQELYSVTIGDNVKVIEMAAFENCTSLFIVTIPDGVEVIRESAFTRCFFSSITIPPSVSFIGKDAFIYCDNIDKVYITDLAKWCKIDFANQYSNPLNGGASLFLKGVEVKGLSIPGSGELGNYAFYGCKSITNLIIPASVSSIGDWAFAGCKNIANITFYPGNLTWIGSSAFEGCTGLTSLTLPAGLTMIGGSAFKHCSQISSVTIPMHVTSIGMNAFYGCSQISSVHIEDIAKWCGIAFDGMESNPLNYARRLFKDGAEVQELTIPKNVTAIRSFAFVNCSNLTSLTIPAGVESIGSYAFVNCSSLASIKVESGNTAYDSRNDCNAIIETKSNELLYGCKNTIIPGSVTRIGKRAFYGCKDLASIIIPSSVTSIGGNAFYDCGDLKDVYVPSLRPWLNISFQDIFSNPLAYDGLFHVGDEEMHDLVIPEDVTDIKPFAFVSCGSLTSVTIPNSVTSLGKMAFRGCKGLTHATIGDGVTSIETETFALTDLIEVTIGSGVKSIGQNALNSCLHLTDVYCLPENPPTTFNNSFSFSPITSATLHVPEGSEKYYMACEPWMNFKSIVPISDFVTMQYGTLYYRLNLKTGEAAVTNSTWGEGYGDRGYTGSIEIPSSVTYRRKEYSVTSIDRYAFYECSGLTSFTIPGGVKLIGESAFEGCSNLASVFIPGSVTDIGAAAFSGCSSLSAVTIPNGVSKIDYYTFAHCSSLKFVTIPGSVKSIGAWALYGCSSLTSVTIPSSVTSIGMEAFQNCGSLATVISMIANPFEIDEHTFNCYDTATLRVPKGTKGKYQTTAAWNKFLKMEEIAPRKGDVNGDGTVDVADISTVISIMAGAALSDASAAGRADVNSDGGVDVADISSIVDIMAGKFSEKAYLTCPDDHHPHLIDMGLPSGTLWACCNVGAGKPEEYGDYYAWGETKTKNAYSWSTYLYGSSASAAVNIGSDIAGTDHDAATANWGGDWHMPTQAQLKELLANTTATWTTQSSVNGEKLTAPNGGTLFLPAAGNYNNSAPSNTGTSGSYWLSTPYESSVRPGCAQTIYFGRRDNAKMNFSERFSGLTIRPVRKY